MVARSCAADEAHASCADGAQRVPDSRRGANRRLGACFVTVRERVLRSHSAEGVATTRADASSVRLAVELALVRAMPKRESGSPPFHGENPMAKSKVITRRAPAGTKSRESSVVHRICNVVPSKNTDKDWKLQDAVLAGSLQALAIPPSVDLRQPWWTIGDQGATGSCVGWAAAEGVVRWHMVKANKLAKTQPLSARQVWMASKETDAFTARPESFIEEAGTSLKAALDICRKHGVVPNATLPFNVAGLMYSGNENSFYALAAQRKIAAYFNLFKNLDQWRTWLSSRGPILAALSVDRTWDQASATHGNLDVFQPGTVRGGHAIAIVGYTSAGRFIVRNSWGVGWGDHGFGYASAAYINAAFFNESYGVTI